MRITVYKILTRLFPNFKELFDAHFFNNVKLFDIIKSNYNNTFHRSKSCFLNGYTNSSNFGDALNQSMLNFLGCKKIILTNAVINKNNDNLLIIGSSIHLCDENTIIWGAGCISPEHLPLCKPKIVKAVRGPLTRKILVKNNINCPEIYGDPALLLPYIYNFTEVKKKYQLGIIPHYIDKNCKIIQQLEKRKDILIIDIQTGSNFKKLIKQMLSCETIISSSLHGLVVADAYNIPNEWCEFSDKVVGQGFKFKDYFASVGRTTVAPLDLRENFDEQIINTHLANWKSIIFDASKLLQSFPYPDKLPSLFKQLC